MNGRLAVFLRKMQHVVLIAFGTVPLFVQLLVMLMPEKLNTLPMFPVIYLLIAALCLLTPGWRRYITAAAGVGALFAMAIWLLPLAETPALLIIPVVYSLLLVVVMPIAGWPLEQELHPVWYGGCLAAFILLQIASDAARRKSNLVYEPAQRLLLISFLLFLSMMVLMLNRRSLDIAAQYRMKVPERVRRQNLLLVLGLLLLVILIAAVPAIGRALRKGWQLLGNAITAVSAFFTSMLSFEIGEISGEAGGGGLMGLPMGEASEPSRFQMILQTIVGDAAIVLIAVMTIWLLWEIIKYLRKQMERFWKYLSRFSYAAAKDYVDEITDTRDEAQYEHSSLIKRLKKRFSRPDESKMTPQERVRYRYLRLRRKHTEWSDAQTARETIPQEAAELYELARYSEHGITQEEVLQFKAKTEKV